MQPQVLQVAATSFASGESDVTVAAKGERDDDTVAQQLAPGGARGRAVGADNAAGGGPGEPESARRSRRALAIAAWCWPWTGAAPVGRPPWRHGCRAAVAGSAVVHTDDIAWWHSRFGWADLLIDGILMPVHRGQPVRFRPPSWADAGRGGAIDVPAACPLLIIEGVGAGRREAAHLIDALIWVQSDQARSRAPEPGPGRAGEAGRGRSRDLREWMAEEEPFLAEQRPWELAPISLLLVLRRSPSIRSPNSLWPSGRPGRRRHDRRAIHVQLTTVIDGQQRYLPDTQTGW